MAKYKQFKIGLFRLTLHLYVNFWGLHHIIARCYIVQFSSIAELILHKKEVTYELKHARIGAPVLECPDVSSYAETFVLQTDVSAYGLGAVLDLC